MALMTLGTVAQYINGRAFKPEEWEENGKPIIRIQNLTNSSDVCNRTTNIYEEKYLVTDGDLLFAWSASLGAHIWHGEDGWLNQHIFKVVPNECVEKMYLYYYLLYVVDQLYAKTHGSGMVHITMKPFKDTPINVPILKEQQRIVDRIESLFAKLDEAKEKAQAVVDGFEDRKAAILMNGVTGKLTEVWRNRYGFTRSDWKTVKLSEVCLLQTGIMKGKHFQTETIKMPYLRVANVQDGFLNLQEIKEIEVEKSNYERYLLKNGDVLFTEGGDFDKLGRGTVWHSEIPNCLHQNHIFVVRPQEGTVLPEYLSYQAGSQYGKKYFLSCSKQTTNLASINSTQLKNFPVMVPSIDEQKEIINIIDGLIASEQKAKEAAEQVIDQIDSMKKSILARAFRGEMGTNDPADESAEELLKRIL